MEEQEAAITEPLLTVAFVLTNVGHLSVDLDGF